MMERWRTCNQGYDVRLQVTELFISARAIFVVRVPGLRMTDLSNLVEVKGIDWTLIVNIYLSNKRAKDYTGAKMGLLTLKILLKLGLSDSTIRIGVRSGCLDEEYCNKPINR